MRPYQFIKRIVHTIFLDHQAFVNLIFQKLFRINSDFPYPIHFSSQVVCPEKIKLGGGDKLMKSFAVSGGCYFSAVNGIHFGKNVLFAPGIKIISSNHDFTEFRNPQLSPPIIIEDDVWIGANAVILPGVHIGQKSIIGAGSIVTKSMPQSAIIVGSPAKVIGYICPCGGKIIYVENGLVCLACSNKYSLTSENEVVNNAE